MIYTSPLIINYLRCSLRRLVCRVVILVWMIDTLLVMQDLYKRERERALDSSICAFLKMCVYSQSLRPDLIPIDYRGQKQWGLGLV